MEEALNLVTLETCCDSVPAADCKDVEHQATRRPGNGMSNMLSALATCASACQYGHTCRQWAFGIVSALRKGSKYKMKTGVKRVVERIIFLELVM
ncbi:hypothetical protein GRJ2_001058500 [Grus japonensis]|uniref:Uncharacterized protein n=1 Tax=Grus japonensis TaxID=30415 RepID=A0ABC9WNJ4_GRUJA